MDGDNSTAVSIWAYCRAVWKKARQIEKRGWLRHVGGEIVPTVLGTAFLIWLFGFSNIVEARRYDLALLGTGLIVFGVVRFVACLLRAPHQIHLEDLAAIATALQSRDSALRERNKARATCEDLKKPTARRGDRNDVIQKFRTLMTEGGRISPQGMADIADWTNRAVACARECLFDDDANQFADPGELKNIQHASTKEQAKYELSVRINRLASWTRVLAEGKADHCVREFSMPIAA